jgi:hypothetical protein
MDTAVILSLIAFGTVLLTGTLAPVTIAIVQYRIGRAERRETNARLDEVARQAKDVAHSQATVAEAAKQATIVVSDKLDVVHGLVNSQLSAALQAEHDALVAQLALMGELIAERKGEKGEIPTAHTLAVMETISNRIAELKTLLADRQAKTPPT